MTSDDDRREIKRLAVLNARYYYITITKWDVRFTHVYPKFIHKGQVVLFTTNKLLLVLLKLLDVQHTVECVSDPLAYFLVNNGGGERDDDNCCCYLELSHTLTVHGLSFFNYDKVRILLGY